MIRERGEPKQPGALLPRTIQPDGRELAVAKEEKEETTKERTRGEHVVSHSAGASDFYSTTWVLANFDSSSSFEWRDALLLLFLLLSATEILVEFNRRLHSTL